MKNSLCGFLILLLFSMLIACSAEKGQAYFRGTIVEITNEYYVIAPDGEKLLNGDLAEQVLVPKEVVRAQEIDFAQDERVQVVYNMITNSPDGPKTDIVYAIYRESELP